MTKFRHFSFFCYCSYWTCGTIHNGSARVLVRVILMHFVNGKNKKGKMCFLPLFHQCVLYLLLTKQPAVIKRLAALFGLRNIMR